MSWIKSAKPILALAPMADYTDGPFGVLCRELSGDDFVIFREMVSAEAITRANAKTLRMCEVVKKERPVVAQIFGGRSEVIARAAEIIMEKFGPDGIDINMGCPVPKIAGRSLAGACLMRDHARAVKIVATLKAANLGVPVSVKTRLGWSRADEILEFAPLLEQAGADLITIHGRTKAQGYGGNADWEMIGRAKKLLSIPVLANGDIHTLADAKRCQDITHAGGVMVGRGALGRPWIFEEIRAGKEMKMDFKRLKKVILRHAELHLARYGGGSIVTFRKHLAWYFKGIPGMKNIKAELVRVSGLEELKNILQKIPN